MDQLKDILFRYTPWVILIPFGIAVRYFRRYPPELKAITLYLLLTIITQWLSYQFWEQKKNNLVILHIYTVPEFLCLFAYYYALLRGFLHRVFFIILAVAFPLFSIFNSLFIEKTTAFNSYSRSVEALIFIFLSASWFVKSVSLVPNEPAKNSSRHFITAGLLIYFSGSILLFALGANIIRLSPAFRVNVWILNTTLAVLLYLLIAVGLWKQKKI